MVTIESGFIPLIIFFILCSAVVPCLAIEPAWTFSGENRKIEDIAVAPDGSAVVAAAGKVLLFSRDGTIFANEPFGDSLAQSQDGSSIVTAYSSTVASTVYLFKKKPGADGNQTLQKMWEAPQTDKVVSFAVSDNGDRIACSTGGKDVFVLDGDTGSRLGNDENFSSRIAISGRGTTIAGIAISQGLKLYNTKGGITKEYDFPLPGQTNSLLVDTDGSIIVFDTGLNIIALNVSNESDTWKRKTSSEVNMLAMTHAGDIIVAGTTNGTVDRYDRKGNSSWSYYSNSGTGSGQAVKAIALTQDASEIIAGSTDGKIILLDDTGTPQWIYTTKNEPIRRVAIAADGSLAVAASDNTIFAFSTGGPRIISKNPVTSIKTPLQTLTSRVRSTISSITRPVTPTITMTEYSVIHKATQSPLDETAGIMAILIMYCVIFRKGR